MGPSWARLGRLLGPFLEPKSGQVGPQIHLEAVFVQKSQCSRNIGKRKARATFLTPRRAQDGLKTGPRRVQERQKSDAFFVLIFNSFWVVLGSFWDPFWEPKSTPRPCQPLARSDLVFDLVIGWSQERPKTHKRPSQEGPKPSKNGPRPPPQTVQRGPKSPQEWLKQLLICRFEVSWGLDSLIQLIASIQ